MFHPKAVHPSMKRFDRVRRKFEIEFPKAFRTYSRNHAQVFAQHRRKCKISNLSRRELATFPRNRQDLIANNYTLPLYNYLRARYSYGHIIGTTHSPTIAFRDYPFM